MPLHITYCYLFTIFFHLIEMASQISITTKKTDADLAKTDIITAEDIDQGKITMGPNKN